MCLYRKFCTLLVCQVLIRFQYLQILMLKSNQDLTTQVRYGFAYENECIPTITLDLLFSNNNDITN